MLWLLSELYQRNKCHSRLGYIKLTNTPSSTPYILNIYHRVNAEGVQWWLITQQALKILLSSSNRLKKAWHNKIFLYTKESLCLNCRYLRKTDCKVYADCWIVCSHLVFPLPYLSPPAPFPICPPSNKCREISTCWVSCQK